jgi:glycosyltransferase involved in cell wall biosynthesis
MPEKATIRIRLAILMPVYQPGPELKTTLASIREQTLHGTLFLVDDGSKSKPDYRELTQGMDARVIELPKNFGIVGALNAGLAEILKGDFEYVARVDNGDINMPERFATQIEYLQNHPELDIVSSHVRYEYELTGLKTEWKGPEDPKALRRLLLYNAPLTHAAIMFRIGFLRAMKAYPGNYPAAEDYAMEFWAARHGHGMANIPVMLYRTIEMSESISGGSRKKQLWSRFRVQRDNADWLNIHTYFGMARTLLLMALPIAPLRRLRRLMAGGAN